MLGTKLGPLCIISLFNFHNDSKILQMRNMDKEN